MSIKKILANRLVQLTWESRQKQETPYSIGYKAGVEEVLRILKATDRQFAREYEELSA